MVERLEYEDSDGRERSIYFGLRVRKLNARTVPDAYPEFDRTPKPCAEPDCEQTARRAFRVKASDSIANVRRSPRNRWTLTFWPMCRDHAPSGDNVDDLRRFWRRTTGSRDAALAAALGEDGVVESLEEVARG